VALADEIEEDRPEMPVIVFARVVPCCGERLARRAPCPNSSAWFPSCKLKCSAPSSDTCEEMTLGKSFEVGWFDIGNTPVINRPVRDQAVFD
jgi:hypothetical protein